MAKTLPPKSTPPVTPRIQLGKKVQAHQRYYLADKTLVPGVTTITGQLHKPQLTGWANRLGLQGIDSAVYTAEAAEVGGLSHHLIEAALKGERPDTSDFSQNQIEMALEAVASWQKWLAGHTLRAVLIEQPLVSEEHRFGGTIDLYGELDGVLQLVDFKTSGAIYREHKIQASAYFYLLKENGYSALGVNVIRIGRDGGALEEHRLSGREVLAGWKAFLALRAVYDHLRQMDGKSVSRTGKAGKGRPQEASPAAPATVVGGSTHSAGAASSGLRDAVQRAAARYEPS